MPGKSLFNRFDDKVVKERVAAFHELFKFIGSDPKYRSSQSVLGFLQDVEVPNWKEVNKTLDERTSKVSCSISKRGLLAVKTRRVDECVRQVMSIPESDWMDKSEKDGAKISVKHVEDSKLYMVRSEIVVKIGIEKMVELYNDLEDWKNWNPDCTFRKVEQDHRVNLDIYTKE